jgi:transketolase
VSAQTPALPGTLDWSDLDRRTVDIAKALAMDAVEAAGSGHPGTAMSLAPVATLLFQRILRHDPSAPDWPGRDRFILSCGHTSVTLYTQLYLSGYGLTLEDLSHLRQWGSLTPGHPEHGHTPGVETTSGPLGQGVGSAVGMAMAARRERGLLDPDTPEGQSPFDHTIWCIASDGDLEEGVSSEASSLAGTQALGNLVLLWDDNRISIEDDTNIAFTEDTAARYEAYGWHVQHVSFVQEDGGYVEDVEALAAAFEAARAETTRPSFIALHTVIAWPAPTKKGTGAAHGSALGADEVRATKELLGLPEAAFQVPDEVVEHARGVVARGRDARAQWQQAFDAWAAANPEGLALHQRMQKHELPAGWQDALPVFEASQKGVATRKASGQVLTALAAGLPELWGGSADLAESNNTTMEGEPSFLPEARQTATWKGSPYGRTLHFGIREHAMGAIMNGIATHGGTRVYGGTFLVFSDYMRGAVRLAALSRLPVTYVWTHDSIGLGEDGPTHQPVEHLASLRAVPGLDVVRPADANETVVAWRTILENTDGPAGLCLTRQNVPTFDRSGPFASAEGVARGAYVLRDASDGQPKVILMGTGSEVQVAVAAQERLEAEGVPTRVVSMPCIEWFRAQDEAYQRTVLPSDVLARVSVEAAVSQGWHEWVGGYGECVSLEHFGASAPFGVLYEQFGLTAERVVAAARSSLSRLGTTSGSTTGN